MVKFVATSNIPNFASLPSFTDADSQRLQETISKLTGHLPPIAPSAQNTAMTPEDFTEKSRDRYRRYFRSAYYDDLSKLAAMPPNSGRNIAVFRFVCRFGRMVHYGLLSESPLVENMVASCTANGLIAEDGARSVLATISSGLRAPASDSLPHLGVGYS